LSQHPKVRVCTLDNERRDRRDDAGRAHSMACRLRGSIVSAWREPGQEHHIAPMRLARRAPQGIR
jgi:hypothetical protein